MDSTDTIANKRETWSGRLDFIMGCLSFAVGLGNIWRFPYLCYRNGGAVFLIPYLIFLFLCAMPLLFAEIAIGQFSSLGPVKVWRVSPLFKGIGYGMIALSFLTCIYYNIIITWAIYYLFHSFYPVLPWSTCGNKWNSDLCTSSRDQKIIHEIANETYVQTRDLNDGNLTIMRNATSPEKLISSSEEYWQNNVLQISGGIDEVNGVRWPLLGCLALAWVIVFVCLSRGIKSSGKAVYVTALFPYVVLFCMLIRALTLPGALDGVKYYVIPQWHRLFELQVWGEAAMQIFYSAGPVWGGLIAMASYNKFDNDCYRDARILPFLNSGTSILAGFVVFSTMGFMAHDTGTTIDKVITQGPGLVFVAYPEATSRLPFGQLWSALFFFMLILIGSGTQITTFQTIPTVLADEFKFVQKNRALVTGILCVVQFLLGIPLVTRGGVYILQIMDWYLAAFSFFVLGFMELIVIGRVYGAERFYKDIELMIGYRPCVWWKILWCYVTPTIIAFLLLFGIFNHTPVTYGSYSYPLWAIGCGWLFALSSILPIPIEIIRVLLQKKGSIRQRLQFSMRPSLLWGPHLEENRKRYEASLDYNKNAEFTVVDNLLDSQVCKSKTEAGTESIGANSTEKKTLT